MVAVIMSRATETAKAAGTVIGMVRITTRRSATGASVMRTSTISKKFIGRTFVRPINKTITDAEFASFGVT